MFIHFRGATARHRHFMAVAISLAQSTLFSKSSIFLHRNALNSFPFAVPFSSSSALKIRTHKWTQPVGEVKMAKDGNIRHSRVLFESSVASSSQICVLQTFAPHPPRIISYFSLFILAKLELIHVMKL